MIKSILNIALQKFAEYNDPVFVTVAFDQALKANSPYLYVVSELSVEPALSEDECNIYKAMVDTVTDITYGDSAVREFINNYKH